MFNAVLAILLFFQHYCFVHSENFYKTNVTYLIESYFNQSQGSHCSNDILYLANNKEADDSLNSWLLTITEDRQTLKVNDLMSSDLKCKFNAKSLRSVNRYCLYGKTDDNDSKGYMLAYCISNSCDDVQAASFGKFAMNFLYQINLTNADTECSVASYNKVGLCVTSIICLLLIISTLLATAIYVIR